jgi:hypothetical protein
MGLAVGVERSQSLIYSNFSQEPDFFQELWPVSNQPLIFRGQYRVGKVAILVWQV